MKAIISIAVALGILGGGAFYYVRYVRTESAANYRTAKVEQGEMLPTIGATGTIEPEEVVDIGAQVTGIITELQADYGSKVEANQKLAQIDPTKYTAARDQAAAALASARANLLLSKANLKKADADLVRNSELIKINAISQADYDTFVANDEVAKSNVGVAQAVIGQAEAALKSAQTDLDYTVIKSPVKGVIVDRRVNVGQTQVSALSASSLFLLAKDLSRVQIWASVNEADIGRIQKGQKVSFTVDTFPNENFVGEVFQIRLNATMTQNVVTYTVVVTTENKDMRLLPYMTANLNFEIERHENVLKVPNAALRWKPRPQQIAADVRADTLAAMNRHGDKSKSKTADDEKAAEDKADDKAAAQDTTSSQPGPDTSPGAAPNVPATPKGTAAGTKPEDFKARAEKHRQQQGKPADTAAQAKREPAAAAKNDAAQPKKLATAEHGPPGTPLSAKDLAKKKEHLESGYLWYVDGNYVRPIKVKIVATDGTMTEVRQARSKTLKEKELQDDMDIVTGENVASEGDDTTNPFMPKLFRGGSSSGKPK